MSASALSAPSPSWARKPSRVARPPVVVAAARVARKSHGVKDVRRAARRRRRGGTRADQAVELVEENPGISASEIAKKMKIKPNYLYRVLGDLEKEGRVKKKGRQYTRQIGAGS